MGVDYTAVAILGVKIYESRIPRIKKKVKEPAFQHSYPETDSFDPKTGAPLWTGKMIDALSDEPLYVLSEDGIYGQSFENGTLSETLLRKWEGRLECYTRDDDTISETAGWVGLVLDDTGSNGGNTEDSCVIPPDFKEYLKEVLEPYGLWDDDNYKLYSILYVSC